MSKRNIEKHILMNKAEAQDLQKKAKRACLSEGGLIRLLLKGYEPREKPDERFYDVILSKLPVYSLEACKKVRCLCHRYYAECGRPFAEPYGKNNACKQRVFDYAQSGFNRQD